MAPSEDNGLAKALKDFALNYALTFLAGAAGALLFSVFLPLKEIVFSLYTPLGFNLKAYVYWWGPAAIATIIYWVTVFKFSQNRFLRLLLPYILAMLLLILAGVMRSETVLPNDIAVQFVLFFSAILLLCEALIIHAVLVLIRFMRESGLIRS